MKEHFFIVFCCACGLFLLSSCGRKQRPAPDFDNRRTRQLAEACGSMEREPRPEDLAAWKSLVEQYPGENFPAVAYRLMQKRLLVSEANDLLSSVAFNRLMGLLRQSEQDGTACPELMAFSQYKDSLDQLRLFVSKMPWTDSRTMQENLVLLDRHGKVLSQSSSYRSFRQSQDRELARLRQLESDARHLAVLRSLDCSLLSGKGLSKASSDFLSLCSSTPDGVESRLLRVDDVQELRNLYQECRSDSLGQVAFEVLCLYRWSGLGPVMRQEWTALLGLRRPLSLSGSWLCARYGLRNDADVVFLELLSDGKLACIPGQDKIQKLLNSRFLSAIQYGAWCWRSPCPGVTELLARLNQLGQYRQKHEVRSLSSEGR